MQNMPRHDREVIAAIVTHALALGYKVGCAANELAPSSDAAAIFAELGECDEERLTFHRDDVTGARPWAYLVYGNEPGVTIADYGSSEAGRAILAVADALADVQEMEDVSFSHKRPATEDVGEGLQLSIAWSGTGFLYGLDRGPGSPSLDLDRTRAVSWLATRESEWHGKATPEQVAHVMTEVAKVPSKIERAA